MPRPIAERLKSDRETRIADRTKQLSVLFADIAGFTGAAHDLAPRPGGRYLDRLVRVFDALAEAHGVEKIKTIGDSYMAAAGFDGRAAEHAVAVGRLALAMIEAVDRHPPLAGRKLKIRIGIHCGAATAGVIGATRFSYDVWGDAVNVASRMESHGIPGPHSRERGLFRPGRARLRVRGARHHRPQRPHRRPHLLPDRYARVVTPCA